MVELRVVQDFPIGAAWSEPSVKTQFRALKDVMYRAILMVVTAMLAWWDYVLFKTSPQAQHRVNHPSKPSFNALAT